MSNHQQNEMIRFFAPGAGTRQINPIWYNSYQQDLILAGRTNVRNPGVCACGVRLALLRYSFQHFRIILHVNTNC